MGRYRDREKLHINHLWGLKVNLNSKWWNCRKEGFSKLKLSRLHCKCEATLPLNINNSKMSLKFLTTDISRIKVHIIGGYHTKFQITEIKWVFVRFWVNSIAQGSESRKSRNHILKE